MKPEDTHRSLLDRFPALARLRGMRRRRIPNVLQTTKADCGPACLTALLRHLGRDVLLEEVRSRCGTGLEGSTALALIEGARHFGLRGRGVGVDVDGLRHLPAGAVLHWSFNHFVLFLRLRRNAVEVMDPRLGRRRVGLAEFSREFTGVALLFEPTEAFSPGARRHSRVWRYVRRIAAHSHLLSRVIVTSALLQGLGLGLPLLTGALVDRVLPRQDFGLLEVLGACLLAMVAIQALTTYIRARLLLHLRIELDAQMTLDFVTHLVSLPFAFFQQRSTGDLMLRLNSNSTVRELLTSGALSSALDGSLVLGYLLVLFVINPGFGLLVLALGAARIGVFLASRTRYRELMSEGLVRQAESSAYQVQLFSGIETLKSSGAESRAVEQWSRLFVDVLNVHLAQGRLLALTESAIATLTFASPLVVLLTGASLVLSGELSVGTMLAMSVLASGFLTPLSSLADTAMRLQELGSYVERIDDVMGTAPEQSDTKTRPAPKLQGGLRFEGVSFRYSEQSPPVLEDVDLEIAPGQMVDIVGPSGAGKSTLAKLALGLHAPDAGRVLVDEHDLRHLDARGVRRQIGCVMQNLHLFGTSIRENLRLTHPALDEEAMQRATRAVQLHDEIAAFPMGYETPLADGGGSLSGGQRQRLALARALIGEPSLLILDEATSSLDSVAERAIQSVLESMRCTRVVIAHRISTVRSADLIVVLNGGRIVERGSHDTLLAEGGLYRELVTGFARPDEPARAASERA